MKKTKAVVGDRCYLRAMSRRAGFTLLEVCLVVVIALLMAGLAVPSVQGLFAEQRLKKTFEQFDDFVRKVQLRTLQERRAFVLIWDGDGITVEPDEPTTDDSVGEDDHFPFTDGTLALERPAVLLGEKEKPPVEWLFWRSGTCEPAIIHFDGKAGTWSVSYDPLTLRAKFLEQTIR
jgi:type II secretory pathway pseudopilin PulG